MESKELINYITRNSLNNFAHAIFPIYRFEIGGSPVHIGTCFSIEHHNRKFLITAAHVIDHYSDDRTLAFATTSQERLVQVQGEWYVSEAGEFGREEDPIDLALHELTEEEACKVPAISSSQIEDQAPDESSERMMTIIGFPTSKNKSIKPADLSRKRLSPVRVQYADMEGVPVSYFEERGMSSRSHVAMLRGARSMFDDGMEDNTIGHRGLSGGPMIFAGLSNSGSPIQPQKVVGVILEQDERCGVVVALRMSEVLRRIENFFGSRSRPRP